MWPFNKAKVVPDNDEFLAQVAPRQPAKDRQLDAIRQLGLDAARYRWLRDVNPHVAVSESGEELDKWVDAEITRGVMSPAADASGTP